PPAVLVHPGDSALGLTGGLTDDLARLWGFPASRHDRVPAPFRPLDRGELLAVPSREHHLRAPNRLLIASRAALGIAFAVELVQARGKLILARRHRAILPRRTGHLSDDRPGRRERRASRPSVGSRSVLSIPDPSD